MSVGLQIVKKLNCAAAFATESKYCRRHVRYIPANVQNGNSYDLDML